MSILALALLTAALPVQSDQFYLDEPLYLFSNPRPSGWPGSMAIGDVNGDGLNDIVSSNGTAESPGTPATHWLSVALQRPGGFEFAKKFPTPCGMGSIHLVETDPDRGLEIIAMCSRRTYSEYWRGFIVLDMKADNSVRTQTLQYDDTMAYAPAISIVDVDQDGRDDLQYVYIDPNTNTYIDYRYVIWYNRGLGKFDSYTSDLFRFSGIDDPSYSQYITPYHPRLDIDGDGSADILQGLCKSTCVSRQEPWKQMQSISLTTNGEVNGESGVESHYGDLDGDGLPDRIMTAFGSETLWIQLQTAESTFTDVAELYPIFLPGNPLIVDLDLNTLADMVVGTERDIVYAMQDSPGQFRVVSQPLARGMMGARLFVADLDGDLCPDVLTVTAQDNPFTLPYAFQFLRGKHCVTPGDLEVAVHARQRVSEVWVSNVAGARTFVDAVLRVDIAPGARVLGGFGLTIKPPAGCVEIAARTPRHMFDCLLATIGPGQTRKLSFGLSFKSAAQPGTQLQTIAFLRESVGDGNPSNDRARGASVIDTTVRHTVVAPTTAKVPASKKRQATSRAADRQQSRGTGQP